MAFPVAAAVAGGQALYQLYQANKQKQLAKRLRPSNFVPNSVKEGVTSARMASVASSPGYTRGLEKLRQSSANTVSNIKKVASNAGQIQQAVADADSREKQLGKDLEVYDASVKAQNRDKLTNLLMVQGGYEKQSQDAYNAAKSALTGAAQRNTINAVTGLGENLAYEYGAGKKLDELSAQGLPDATGAEGGDFTGNKTTNPQQMAILRRLYGIKFGSRRPARNQFAQ